VSTLGAAAPLAGRVALVTGVSRRVGIAYALTARLAADGASVLATGFAPYDASTAWGADPTPAVPEGERVRYISADLASPDAPASLVGAAVEAFGAIDIVIACHARSVNDDLATVTAAELDLTFAINTRGTILLAQALAAQHDDRRPGGRFLLFTSGQHLGPMAGELSYVTSKGANLQVTATLADALADRGITVNCVNPGPVDTGYAFGADHAHVASLFPARRWGTPEDTANLVAWLVSDQAAWITGQVLNSEGGFRRSS
jgi:3-oxoacyl-[acyl-carrier protein] reductase